MVKITSSPLVFVDQTDSRKFEIQISSNLPQTQLYDKNTTVYTPDWSNTPLNLQASIYLDSTDITANVSDIKWYKNSISEVTKIGEGKTLTINTNVLATEPIITYICQAKYQNLTTGTRIDYTRIDSGVNGSAGASAPAVQAQYSVDGSAWTSTLNASAHKYVRYSYDGGITWTTSIKMAGEDGKSVSIKGTATAITAVSGTNYYTVTYGGTSITTAALGDSYLYNGDLYVCSELRDGADYFINVGKIQGPQGNDGESTYVYIRYATSSSGANMATNPSSQTTYIGIHVSNTTTAPTTANSYMWSKFVGDSAKSIVLSGDSQVFKVSTSSAYTPETIKVTAQAFNTSVTAWTYNTYNGQGFVSVLPTGVTRSGNVVTINGADLATNSVVIKASDGTVEDVFTVYKAFDGTNGVKGDAASMAFLTNENVTLSADSSGVVKSAIFTTNVVAYKGGKKETPVIGTITGASNMTVEVGSAQNNEIPITFTITNSNLGSALSNNGSIIIPIDGPSIYTNLTLSWSKVNSGAKGTDASLVKITPSSLYFKSTTGKDGTFNPEFIYLYPRFQNATYSNWQYSVDGGITWAAASGANGISIGTYSSVANTLRISRASTLYTDTVTSISFRCNSTASGIYDTVSIAKIYDVVDLQIGGRNLVLNSNKSISSIEYLVRSYEMSEDWILGTTYTITIKGTVNSGQAFGIWANGSATRVATLTYDSKTGLHKAIFTPTTISTQVEKTLRVYNTASATATNATIEWIKLEKGNKATDWTPAPEDIDANIATVNTTLTNSIADVKTTTNSISSRVSATETSITTINGNVSSLITKVSAAEQKITPTAIVSTVRQSTDYTNDLSKKVGTTEIISKINQTAESVTISANKIGLLGATNIPDLTADKIKGGTLTLGGSSATTQSGQLLVKNASNVDMLKLNKDGIVVKSGHLAVASDFANSTYNWSTNTWTTTTNTSQLDLGDDYIRMGIYSPSGYSNYMRLLENGLYFQGNAQGIGSWGSFIGHDDYGDFVIQDTVRGYVIFRGQDDTELAMIDGAGIASSALYNNTISSASNVHINSSGRMYRSTSSSQRYKTDIQDIQSEDLKPEKLYDLPVREFKYKDGYLSQEDCCVDAFVPGFIAEEVADIYPIACEYDGDKPENWNIRFIVPAMLKLIQDQKKEIEALKQKLTT